MGKVKPLNNTAMMPEAAQTAEPDTDVTDFEHLYKSMWVCKKNTTWKDSVAHFYLNGISESLNLENQFETGQYKPRPPHEFQITHPKPRKAISISFRDRVYQRSLNDNIVYPEMTKSFIYANLACQKGKGTDAARELLKNDMRKAYQKYGLHCPILTCDIKGYYDSLHHDYINKAFRKRIGGAHAEMAINVLDGQYSGTKGYNPGSQMVQIAGISALDPMDHFIKEKLQERIYRRYMDDFNIINPSIEKLKEDEQKISNYLLEIGLQLHPKKTYITDIHNGILFLGFIFRVTETGKVLMLINPDNVKAERKRLYREVRKAERGEMSRKKIYEGYQCWRNHASKGNCSKVIERMDKYMKELWR